MTSKKDNYKVLIPGKLRKLPNDALYVSERGKIYDIKKDAVGFWSVTPRQGGLLPKILKQKFLTFKQAEDSLIFYLRKKEKFGRAKWPNRGNSEQ